MSEKAYLLGTRVTAALMAALSLPGILKAFHKHLLILDLNQLGFVILLLSFLRMTTRRLNLVLFCQFAAIAYQLVVVMFWMRNPSLSSATGILAISHLLVLICGILLSVRWRFFDWDRIGNHCC